MGYIKINQDKVTDKIAKELITICPFNAFEYVNHNLSINAACKVCKICVKKGPINVCEFVEEKKKLIDKKNYKGITIYIEQCNGKSHPVAWELLGKAKELAKITKEPVYAIVIGEFVKNIANEAILYGADKVFVYENKIYKDFNVEIYTNVFETFFSHHKVNIILFGGTAQGRSFAPRVAARLRTGLTADCTSLDIKQSGDLLQIRPAFGGNIMAKITTPNNRPQLATIRYKTFNAPEKSLGKGKIIFEETRDIKHDSSIKLLKIVNKPETKDISDAEVIIAVGRGFKKQKDLELIKLLAKQIKAEIACTRPLVENGWFDPRRQIGLSGRTVKPKLIINCGISGSVQFIEGMKESELIISINNDLSNKLFDISHFSIHGDIYEVLPELNTILKENI